MISRQAGPGSARRHLLILAVAVLAGCGGSEGALAPGTYTYEASHPAPGGGDTIRIRGMLRITEAAADTLEGSWEVPQLHPELRVLESEEDGLVLIAHPTYFGTLYHRITGSGRGIACAGEYSWVAEGGSERSVPVTCSLVPGAEEVPPGLEPVETPIVRPMEDTAAPG